MNDATRTSVLLFVAVAGLSCLAAMFFWRGEAPRAPGPSAAPAENTARDAAEAQPVGDAGPELEAARVALERSLNKEGSCEPFVRRRAAAQAARWKSAAASGHPVAQHLWGYCLELGVETPKNERDAVKLFRLAADQGYLPAVNSLAAMYIHGRGVSQDFAQARKLYQTAADKGFAPAQRNLGEMYTEGVGVQADPNEAAKWYHLAAAQGETVAEYRLGEAYETSAGVEQNPTEAAKWYERAARFRYKKAIDALIRLERPVPPPAPEEK